VNREILDTHNNRKSFNTSSINSNLSIRILFGLLLILSSCNSSHSNQNKVGTSASTYAYSTFLKLKEDSFRLSILKVQHKVLYVINKNGAEFKKFPADTSRTEGKISCGEGVWVFGEQADWYKIDEDREGLRTQFYYTKKSNLDTSVSKFKLTEDKLSVVDAMANEISQKQEEANKLLKFNLINKSAFEDAKKNSAIYFIADTNNTSDKKSNGILKLKTKNGFVKYNDGPDPDNDEVNVINQYCGEYPVLNKYIVYRPLFESHDYYLVDKTSGKETGYYSFPLISPNRRYLTDIVEYMEPTAVFDLYTINSDSIKPLIQTWFKNWLPVESGNPPKNDMFWGKDGELYIKVRNAKYRDDESFNPDKDCQYIKINIKSDP
jgi:hypothetical protein